MIDMSKRKNEEVLKNILNTNYLQYTKKALISSMLHQEVAGQRVFYVFLKQHGYDINPEDMDKCQSDGLIGNCIIECKLNSEEGGGPRKAYQELYTIIPNRLKSKGLRVPYYRIYIELETFKVQIYTWDSYKMIDSFDWYENPEKFKQYFEDNINTYSYDLSEESVDLVEVIQNIYEEMNITDKLEAYKILEDGIEGWFKPFDIKKANINKLILNNDKMNEKYVQKVQGAFFTPSQYVKISTEYVLKAIEESKKDGYDDYVVVDRCAGVGNLESQFPEEVYKHMILGTINQAEALTANIRFNGMTEVVVQDALSRDGVLLYKKKIEERIKSCKKLAVIFLENPPYLGYRNAKINSGVDKLEHSYVWCQMKEMKVNMDQMDLDEEFIWSCFEVYKPYAYIHYGPLKTVKVRNLVNKEAKAAYLCNRRYFNATDAALGLIWWSSKNKESEYIDFDSDSGKYRVKRVHSPISNLLKSDEDGVLYVQATNYGISGNVGVLTTNILDKPTGPSRWYKKVAIRNIFKICPIFCAGRDDFSMTGINPSTGESDFRVLESINKSADGGYRYLEDKEFLQDCLLYILCTNKHKIENKEFYKYCEEELDMAHKNTEMYRLYKELVESTGVNGLKNIEKYKTDEYGDLYIYAIYGPTIERLKKLLSIFQYEVIRPKLLEYELLK